MSIEAALTTILQNNSRLQTAWTACDGARAEFELAHGIDADKLTVYVTSSPDGQLTETHADAGQFDPARLASDPSPWQLWPELGLPADEHQAVQATLAALDYDKRRQEAAQQLGVAVDLHHPQTIAMRSLTRAWAHELEPQALLEKTREADAIASMLDTAPPIQPPTCLIDEATICYLAVKPIAGDKTAGVPLGATAFRDGFDLSLLLELQGVACYDQNPDAPGGRNYLDRQNFSIPLISFDRIKAGQPDDDWRLHHNYAIITEEHEPIALRALTTLSERHDKSGFSAQFCGVLTSSESVEQP